MSKLCYKVGGQVKSYDLKNEKPANGPSLAVKNGAITQYLGLKQGSRAGEVCVRVGGQTYYAYDAVGMGSVVFDDEHLGDAMTQSVVAQRDNEGGMIIIPFFNSEKQLVACLVYAAAGCYGAAYGSSWFSQNFGSYLDVLVGGNPDATIKLSAPKIGYNWSVSRSSFINELVENTYTVPSSLNILGLNRILTASNLRDNSITTPSSPRNLTSYTGATLTTKMTLYSSSNGGGYIPYTARHYFTPDINAFKNAYTVAGTGKYWSTNLGTLYQLQGVNLDLAGISVRQGLVLGRYTYYEGGIILGGTFNVVSNSGMTQIGYVANSASFNSELTNMGQGVHSLGVPSGTVWRYPSMTYTKQYYSPMEVGYRIPGLYTGDNNGYPCLGYVALSSTGSDFAYWRTSIYAFVEFPGIQLLGVKPYDLLNAWMEACGEDKTYNLQPGNCNAIIN